MRMSFSFKIAIAISLSTILTLGGTGLFFYKQTYSVVFDLIRSRLKDTLKVSSFLFKGDEITYIKDLREELLEYVNEYDYQTVFDSIGYGEFKAFIPDEITKKIMIQKPFQSLLQRLRQIRASGQTEIRSVDAKIFQTSLSESIIQYSYLLVRFPQVSSQYDDYIYFFLADADYEASENFDANPLGNVYRPEQSCFSAAFNGKVDTEDKFIFEPSSGTLLTGAVPIFSKNGEVLAILGMDYEVTSAVNKLRDITIYLYIAILIGVLFALIVSILLSKKLTESVKILRIGAERVQNRDFTAQVYVKSRDELGLLGTAFNSMVQTISDYSREMLELNKIYFRFVPKEFLDFLEIKNIKNIQLGDYRDREMTVLFTDIRSFTPLSEQMKSQEIFNFLNTYLSYISPVIKKNNGFIDKYIGDAVMALFPNGLDGVLAAIDLRVALKKFNEQRKKEGLDPIDCGIGVNTGELTLGTVGTSERMDTTVISDVVNVAARLEGYTKVLSSSIIVSESTYKKVLNIEESKAENIQFRFLGRVRVRGKEESIGLYQVLTSVDFDLESTFRLNPTFEKAVVLFSQKKYVEAGKLFEEVLRHLPEDKVSLFYLEQSKIQITDTVAI